MTYAPTYTASSGTITPSTTIARYRISEDMVDVQLDYTGSFSGTPLSTTATCPISSSTASSVASPTMMLDAATTLFEVAYGLFTSSNIQIRRFDGSNFSAISGWQFYTQPRYSLR